MTAIISVVTELLRILEDDPRLYIEAAMQITAGGLLISNQSEYWGELQLVWQNMDEDYVKRFSRMPDEKIEGIPRCNKGSCRRGWSSDGKRLLACSVCEKVRYCSYTCQKSCVIEISRFSSAHPGL